MRSISKEESGLRLSERGEWFYHNEPFLNPNIIQYFHQAIRRDQDGRYYLFSRVGELEEHIYFEAEDTAFFVEHLDFDEKNKSFSIRLNNGRGEILNIKTLHEDGRGVMYCRVMDNDRARLSHNALMTLSEHAKTQDECIYIDVTGEKVVVSKM